MKDARWLLLLALAALLPFLPALTASSPTIPGAAYTEAFPWYQTRAYTALRRAAGELPLWNPQAFCGVPHLAALQGAVLYPPGMLYTVLPVHTALTLSYALHCWLAGTGVFLLLRELALPPPAAAAGGCIFMYSAPLLMQAAAGHISVVVTLAWTGFIVAGVLRMARDRAGALPLTALVFALQVYAGHIQYAYYTLLAAGAYAAALCLARRRTGGTRAAARLAARYAAALLLALALAAMQLLPAAELALHSARRDATVAMSATFSLSPESLLLLLAPGFFGDTFNVPYWGRWLYWEMCGYAGVVTVALTLAAAGNLRLLPNRRHLLFFLLLAVAAVMLAFGGYLPALYRVLHAWLPGYALFRGSAKVLFLVCLALAVLAAHAFAALPRTRLWVLPLLAIVLGAFAGSYADDGHWRLLLAALQARHTGNAPPLDLHDPVLHDGLQAYAQYWLWRAVLLLLASWLVLWRLRGRRATLLLGLLLLADLGQFAFRNLPVTELAAVQPDERPLRWLQAHDRQPFRVLAPGQQQNYNYLLGIDNIEGDDSIVLREYQQYLNASQGETTALLGRAARVTRLSPYTHRLNLRYLLLPAAGDSVAGTDEVYRDDRWRILRVAEALPRVHWYPAVRAVPEGMELATLADTTLPWRTTAVVTVPPPAPLTGHGAATIVAYAAERVTLAVTATGPGLLVLADVWYPGWEALVDGVEQPVIRANYLARGIYLPGGEHVVVFRYRPWTFRVGLAVTLLALAGLTGWLLLRILRRQRP